MSGNLSFQIVSKRSRATQAGFSLLELSIVMVIIALITGSVFGGRELLRLAELKKVIKEVDQYRASINHFYDEYKTYPGDLARASVFFPSCSDSGSNPCNGDGNQQVNAPVTDVVSSTGYEHLRFWQHLSLSEYIPYSYTGVGSGANANLIADHVNAPGSGLENGVWGVVDRAKMPGDSNMLGGYIVLGTLLGDSTYDSYPQGGIFEPVELRNLDSKMDDGYPRSGKVRVMPAMIDPSVPSSEPDSDCFSGNAYATDQSEVHCIGYFLFQ